MIQIFTSKVWLKNEISLKRWQRFKKNRSAIISVWVLIIISFLSLTANIWANNKPIVLKFKSEYYFPAFKYYHPSKFGIQFGAKVNYKKLEL